MDACKSRMTSYCYCGSVFVTTKIKFLFWLLETSPKTLKFNNLSSDYRIVYNELNLFKHRVSGFEPRFPKITVGFRYKFAN